MYGSKSLCDFRALAGKTTEVDKILVKNLIDNSYTACHFLDDSVDCSDEVQDDEDRTCSPKCAW